MKLNLIFLMCAFSVTAQETLLENALERDLKELDQFERDLFSFQYGDSQIRSSLKLAVDREVVQSTEQVRLVRRNIGATRVSIAEDTQKMRELTSKTEKKELKKTVKAKVRTYNQQEKMLREIENRTAYQLQLQEEISEEEDPGNLYRQLSYFQQTMAEDISERRLYMSLDGKVSDY